jgi:carbonic anhydrase
MNRKIVARQHRKSVKLYGFFYEISSGKLTEVVRDIPA